MHHSSRYSLIPCFHITIFERILTYSDCTRSCSSSDDCRFHILHQGQTDCKSYCGSRSRHGRLLHRCHTDKQELAHKLATFTFIAFLWCTVLPFHCPSCGVYQNVPSVLQQFDHSTCMVDQHRISDPATPSSHPSWGTRPLTRENIWRCLGCQNFLLGQHDNWRFRFPYVHRWTTQH